MRRGARDSLYTVDGNNPHAAIFKVDFYVGLALLVVLAFGCGWPYRPQVVAISKPSDFRPSSPNDIQTVGQAMAAVITVCRDNLDLPTIDPIYLHLYENSVSFAYYGVGWKTLPLDIANVVAFAEHDKIHINLEKLRDLSWGRVLPLLAHEYGHNIHYRLSGGQLSGTTWFAEGFGEWMAARVVDALGWQPYEVTLHRAQRELSRHRAIVPGLSWLQGKRDWETFLQKPKGYVRTYDLSFVAVDRLIEKKGLASAVVYMKSGDFEGSFGESQVAYKTDTGILGSGLEQSQTSSLDNRKPQWRVGYEWVYEERVPATKRTLRKRLIKEDSVFGLPVFVVRVDNEEELYVRDTLGLVATKKDGKINTQRDRPNEFFAWPLGVTQEWRNTYTIKDLETKQVGIIRRLMVVPRIEEVKVSAGTFKAAKIEAYDDETGRLDAEYWYSPTAKWFVRSINYSVADGFARIQELINFKVD